MSESNTFNIKQMAQTNNSQKCTKGNIDNLSARKCAPGSLSSGSVDMN